MVAARRPHASRRHKARDCDGSPPPEVPATANDSVPWKARKPSHVKVLSVYGMMAGGMLLVMSGLGIWCAFFTNKPGIVSEPNSTYDYIVVGAGTAGCVIAGRLTEANPESSILLVEAGGEFGWLASVPFASPLLQGSVKNDWQYRTVSQKESSWGLQNRVSFWPRGKGLGGTGQLNYMLHSLGRWNDFERWKRDHGVQGWDSSTLLGYVRRMFTTEAFEAEGTCDQAEESAIEDECENRNLQNSLFGTMPSARQPGVIIETVDHRKSPIAKAFVDAGKELNIESEMPDDPEYGFMPAMSTIAHGQRWSSFHGYLKPVMDRPNLHVLLNTYVTKVLFSSSGNDTPTAVALQLASEDRLQEGDHRIVHANREIILCAGAINSPQILMLSGIGPKEHLEELQIPVVADLPVGNNLFDHLNMPVYVSLEKPVSITKERIMTVRTIWDYMINNKGKNEYIDRGLLSSSGVQGIGKANPHSGLIVFGMGTTDDALRDVANFRSDTFNELFPLGYNVSQEGMIILSTCLQPESRGTVRLKDKSALSNASIDPNYLSRKEDVQCMAQAVRLAVKVAQTKSFKKLGAKVHLPRLPQCSQFTTDINNDEYLECIIRTGGITGYHPGGTCKMGRGEDPSTVVDNNLNVKGVRRLRVMDASVLPTSISGTPNSVLIAMAERAADLIAWSNFD